MYYFDNKYLKQYLDQNVKLAVFVNSEWYNVPDMSDVADRRMGVAYDEYGEATEFDYRDVEQIRAGRNVVTLDMLQTQRGEAPPKEAPKPAGDEGESEEIPEEEPTGKDPDLSWYSPHYDLGRMLIRESQRQKQLNKK